jgi:hypothetical protein
MARLREKAQARTMQIVGQMIGDEKLVQEGKEEERKADEESSSSSDDGESSSDDGEQGSHH